MSDVARRLGTTRHRVYQLLGENRFPRANRIGEAGWIWQVPEGDVTDYLEAKTQAAVDAHAAKGEAEQ